MKVGRFNRGYGVNQNFLARLSLMFRFEGLTLSMHIASPLTLLVRLTTMGKILRCAAIHRKER